LSAVSSNSITTIVPVIVNPRSHAPSQSYRSAEAQLEVWLSSLQSTAANCAYNQISSLTFTGELNKAALKKAFAKVVERHPSLRTTFSSDGQQANVFSSLPFGYRETDLSGCGDSLQEALSAVIREEAHTPFDLIEGPLVRLVLQTLSPTEHKLTVTAHHIVQDGWSLSVICKDLGYFYDVLTGIDRQPLPPACTYKKYSEEMQRYFESEAGQADEAFWINQFADQIPVLDLPIEKSRPPLRTYNGARYDHLISKELLERVRALGAKHGCSLFNVMLASFNAFVARISGNDDFCICIPTAGQAAMDQLELVGHCVNAIPLRSKVDINASFIDYLKSSRTTFLNAFDHQRYSYGTLLRKLAPPRDPSRPPMLSISFNIDQTIDVSKMGFGELGVDITLEPRAFENFEWFINGVIQADKSIEMQVQYNSDLHTKRSMQFYMEGYATFLAEIASNPQRRIADFHCMSVPQRQQVIVDWNATEMEYPTESTLHQEFSRQARATPDKVAVCFNDTSLTYAEVESSSNQIARYLSKQGVAAGDLVGICVERSAQMLVNLYGILKSGAGYVPLDPAYPSERLQYMCEHSGLKLIVTQEALMQRVAEFNKPMIAIDLVEAEIRKQDAGACNHRTGPSDICYVIYTSGSTGKPKGVQVPHGAVVNFLYAMQQTPGFGPDESVLAVTTLSFDIAVLELYLPTVSGGRVVILDSITAADGSKLAHQLEAHNISLLQATPATWRLMIQAGWAGKRDLKVLCGGEPMPSDLVGPLLERCSELWNMYGPTETTVWSAAFQITNAADPILIGKPIGNTQIFILDALGNEAPVGCEGEVFIGGAGVTCGYRNQPDLTDERFVANRYRNPFKNYVNDKIYKTGDLARYTFDGNIQFLRRNDKQVKVRGFRIELGEIELALKRHPAIEQNVVIVREDKPGDARLVAYLITRSDTTVTPAQLRDHLREMLPSYMVPQHFIELERMPQTNNGKIDYKALPAPLVDGCQDAAELESPTTDAQKYLAGVWSEVLELDEIGINETFFDIGGHSLLVMKVITKIFEATQVKLGPQEFLISTLEQLALKLEGCGKFPGQIVGKIDSGDATTASTNNAWNQATGKTQLDAVAPQSNAPASATEIRINSESNRSQPEADRDANRTQKVFRVLKGFWN
jgi:amino acid adenylation domain-containing protein